MNSPRMPTVLPSALLCKAEGHEIVEALQQPLQGFAGFGKRVFCGGVCLYALELWVQGMRTPRTCFVKTALELKAATNEGQCIY